MMKSFYLSMTLVILISSTKAFTQGNSMDHGDGNGGDDFELALKTESS
jgi:hypothetical protein